MAECHPFPAGDQRDQIIFDFFGVFVPRKPQAMAEPRHVRIDYDARRDAKGRAENDVGRLPAYARQFDQFSMTCGASPPPCSDQQAAAVLNALGLVAKKAGALDRFFQLGNRGLGIVGRRAVLAEQVVSDDVHPLVGALGRKDGRHEQFQGRLEVQRAGGIGVAAGEQPNDVSRMS